MEVSMEEIKRIALVAHDNRKKDLVEWVEWNYKILIDHKLICTGTTGALIEKTIKAKLKNEDAMQYEITLLIKFEKIKWL